MVYGIHKGKGDEFLRAYQVGGYSSSGNLPGLFKLNKISNIEITNEKFENPAPGYTKNDPAISHIYCQV